MQVLGRRVGRLDDVDVPAPHVLVDLDEDLAVSKPPSGHVAQLGVKLLRDLLGERPIGRPAEEQHVLRRQRQFGHNDSPER